MTSTDATAGSAGGPGEPPERWTGNWPDAWSDPVDGQLELDLTEPPAPDQQLSADPRPSSDQPLPSGERLSADQPVSS
ncbi:hypothetical protein, partial [Streptomyces albus]|uniref:hypothetical protein n=1 Tax=Streptomyces albus TaxID=1888 RepID=UPI0033CA3527